MQNFLFLIPALIASGSFVFVGYLLSRILKRNDVADALWGLGFIIVALVTLGFRIDGELPLVSKCLFFGILLWGGRLSIYLGGRLFTKAEDLRYANWRKSWKENEPKIAFFNIFLLQGVILFIVSLPVAWSLFQQTLSGAIKGGGSVQIPGPFAFLGVCIFIVGFLYEVVADFELAYFKKLRKNSIEGSKVLCSGLWARTRHPNYFGEILIWWGFYFLVLDLALSQENYFEGALLTLLSPLTITYLLVKVSGVPMLEKVMEKKGVEYGEYSKSTASLVPFCLQDLKQFLVVVGVLALLDFFWLGIFMHSFYLTETASIARLNQAGEWQVWIWPALSVYLFLGLGVILFAVKASATCTEAVFKGALFGLVVYAVYEFTNLSLVKDWPPGMALVDIFWGSVLCAVAAFAGDRVHYGRSS